MMSDKRIIPIVMPKWGLSMQEGKVTSWLVKDGDQVKVGDQILEVETDKIAGAVEASDAGILRRRIGEVDTIYPIKTLIGVVADADVADADIDATNSPTRRLGGCATPSAARRTMPCCSSMALAAISTTGCSMPRR
jgi:pyruvate/2-oxoglutarate dehydrogenase complex dihydrolipoamide acyltransferase (E2) component